MVTAASHAEQIWIPRLPGLRRVRTGMGERSGEVLARLLDADDKPSIVVGTGFCGGLSPDLKAGMIIIGEAIDFQGEEISVDSSLIERARSALGRASLPFCVGKIVTKKNVIKSPPEKDELANGGHIAVDMESGPLARAAREMKMEFLPLRVVLDSRDWRLPFVGDRLDALRSITSPISTLRLIGTVIVSGRAIGRAIAAIAAEFASRREECVA